MPYPDALGQQPLDKQQAYAALAQFAADYGRDALLLLIHACLPETLRPELLHLIRVNFQPGTDHSLEADILFSPLATALGGGYYRIDPQVRWHGLALLRARYRDDPRPRSRRVAELLWRYVEEAEQYATRNADPQLAEYLAIQRWVALAFLEPASAAHAFADALRQATDGPAAAAVRLGGLAAAIELPLAGEQELLAYARGLDALARGQEDEARQLLECLGEEVKVGDIVLKPPAVLPAEDRPATGDGTAAPRRRAVLLCAPGVLDAELVRAALAENDVDLDSLEAASDAQRYQRLLDADLVICDLSSVDATTCYRLGVALALRRNGILLIFHGDLGQILDSLTLSMAYRYEPAGDSAESRARLRAWIRAHAAHLGGPPLSPSPLYVDGKLRPPALAGPYSNPMPPLPTSGGRCLVLQPFGMRSAFGSAAASDFELIFRYITESLERHGLACLRLDPSNSAVTHQDLRMLQEADLLIANLTLVSPDLLVHLGMRFGLRPARTLLLARDGMAIPSDLVGCRVIHYTQTAPVISEQEGRVLSETISRYVENISSQAPVDSPVYLALPNLHPAERIRPRVFISYAHAYGRFVRPLAAALEALDLEVNRDVDLVQGENWAENLAALLDRADLIVCVIGRDTTLSTFQMAEIQRALESGKRVVPVLVEPLYGVPDTLIRLITRPCANRDENGQPRYLASVEPDALPPILQRTAVHIRAALDAPIPAEPVDLRQLTIRGNETGRMHYLLDENGRREWTRYVQHEFVTGFRDALREHPADLPKALEYMADSLLPADFATLPPTQRYRLLLDAEAAAYPWELILAQRQNRLSAPLPAIRRPDGNLFSIQRSAPHFAALLIGNPSSDGTYGEENPRLPPPEQGELFDRYRRTLESRGMAVSLSMGEGARGVVAHLYAREFGILLISGTYLQDYRLDSGRTATGFVLSDGMFLSIEELRQMRSLPALVVLDNPHTGSRSLGAEMAPALLKAGVPCVVVSAWGVERSLAGLCLESLLAAVATGECFADAHAAAIRACSDADPVGVAWGAFQAWGDPEFRLTPPAA